MDIQRVLVIGLDGASPHLIEHWRHDLPTLSRLMREGTWGTLRSVIPPYTLPAWPAMFTGVNPGKLGIFGFRDRAPGSYRFSFSAMAKCSAPAVWDVLGGEGRTCGVIGVPGTFPPYPVNGFMVSGFPAPANDGRLVFSYPPEVSRILDERYGLYELEVYESYRPGHEEAFARACFRVAQMQWEAALWLAQQHTWDLLVVVSLTIDKLSHYFWRFIDAGHPDYRLEEAEQWGHILKEGYRREDMYLGQMLEIVPDDTLVVVASDHGFCGRYRTIYINEWLRQKGYLRLNLASRENARVGRFMEPLVRAYQQNRWMRRLLAPLRRTALRDRALAAHHAYRYGTLRLEHAPVDWSRTVAYALDQHRIYLNLRGREPMGAVDPAEYESVLARLESELREMVDDDGRSPNVVTYRGRHIYSGPYRDEGPDLLLFCDDFHTDLSTAVGGGRVWAPAGHLSGVHHPDGVFILHGPGVRTGHRLDAHILDIAPTLLHALDAPIPAHCDGRVLHEAFVPSSPFCRRPPRYEHVEREAVRETEWAEEEEARMVERLEDLGYL